MNVIAWILGIVLVGVFGFAGATKLVDLDRLREHFGYTKRQYQLVGLSELAAGVGIIVGLISRQLEWLAIAAGIGLCCLLMGALIAHARVDDDGKKAIPALAMFVVVIVFMIVISLR